jgi:hypothetical protein
VCYVHASQIKTFALVDGMVCGDDAVGSKCFGLSGGSHNCLD